MRLLPEVSDDLSDLWAGLITQGAVAAPTLWLLFFDAGTVACWPPVMIDGLPEVPEPGGVAGLRHVVEHQVIAGVADSVALLLERPGAVDMSEKDRVWARSLLAEMGPELMPRPIWFSSGLSLRQFAPDDLIA